MILKDIFLVALGLMALMAYIFTGGPFGKYRYLVNKPSYTLFISPLPLVFDTEDFFKQTRITKEDFAGDVKIIKVDKSYFEHKNASPHVRLHYVRFLGFSRYFVADENIKGLFCDEETKKIRLEVYLPSRDKDYVTDREVLCFLGNM